MQEHKTQSNNSKSTSFKKRSHSILPPPAILQAYEDLSKGSAARIIEMAEIEQLHRHEWEDNSLKAYTKSNRIGQLFGLIISCLIICCSTYLAMNDNQIMAAIISGSGFASLAITSLVALSIKRHDKRPRIYRNRTPAATTENS